MAFRSKTIRSLGYIALLLFAIPPVANADIDTSKPEFNKAWEQYEKIKEKYPTIRKQEYDKLLSDHLESAQSQYQQKKKEKSNLSGRGVAKEAIKIVEEAREELEETGDFSFPGAIRPQLQDLIRRIKEDKQKIDEELEARKKRLKNSLFTRFVRLAEEQVPDIGMQTVNEEFTKWFEQSGRDSGSEDKDEDGEDEKKADIKSSEMGLDIYTKEFKELHEKFGSLVDKLESKEESALEEFLDEKEEKAREWYAEQKKIRNVKGMAIAGEAVNTLADLLSALKEEGEFEIPPNENLRSDLHDYFDELRDEKRKVLKEFNERENQLAEEGFKRFKAIADKQVDGLDPDELRAVFESWRNLDYSNMGKDDGGSDPAARKGEDSKLDRLYFANQGDSHDWFTVGVWKAKVNAMEIFEVPVYGGEDAQGKKPNPQSGTTSKWKYEHNKALEEDRLYAFRLKKLKDCEPVSVMEWPSLGNDWVLEVRTGRKGGEYGFEIQAGDMVGEEGETIQRRLVSIPVQTKPKGARVYVDGERYRVPGGNSVTPLKLKLDPGSYTIRLRKDNHLPKKIEKFRVRKGERIQHRLKHESELPGKRIQFAPGKSWKKTKVEVDTGDKIWVVPEGSWICGEEGEEVGPEGYPRSEYPHYYKGDDLRKVEDANYGALLMKVGEKYYGAPPEVEDKRAIPVPGITNVTAKTWGELWFDVNEKDGQKYRFNNRGVMNLKIVVMPDGEVPSDD